MADVRTSEVYAVYASERVSLHHIGRLLGAASTGLLSISPPQLPVGDLSQPLVGIISFQVAELSGSAHRLTSRQSSQSVL
jgi:hypothetical protein